MPTKITITYDRMVDTYVDDYDSVSLFSDIAPA